MTKEPDMVRHFRYVGKPVAYDSVTVTARIHIQPGTDAQVVAEWLMSLTEGAKPEGVGVIDWSFEVPR